MLLILKLNVWRENSQRLKNEREKNATFFQFESYFWCNWCLLRKNLISFKFRAHQNWEWIDFEKVGFFLKRCELRTLGKLKWYFWNWAIRFYRILKEKLLFLEDTFWKNAFKMNFAKLSTISFDVEGVHIVYDQQLGKNLTHK